MIRLEMAVKRDADAVPCPKCKGYADRVSCTAEEIKDVNCMSHRTYECCARAFVCRVCGERIVGTAEAPEAD